MSSRSRHRRASPAAPRDQSALSALSAASSASPSPPAADSPWLVNLLSRHSPRAASLLNHAGELRVQLLIGIERPARSGDQQVELHTFRADAEYFYPASCVKLAIAAAALNMLAESRSAGHFVDWNTSYYLDAEPDFGAPGSGPHTVRDELIQIMAVSDNPASNRLYELVGHDPLQHFLRKLGLRSAKITHRLSDFRSEAQQRLTPSARFVDSSGRNLLEIPRRQGTLEAEATRAPGTQVGLAHIDPVTNQRIDEPLNCAHKNAISLRDLQALLRTTVGPEFGAQIAPACPGSSAHPLLELMCQSISDYRLTDAQSGDRPRFDPALYPNGWNKWLSRGLQLAGFNPQDPSGPKLAGKLGRAYGFSTENALLIPPAPHDARWPRLWITGTIFTCQSGLVGANDYQYAVADDFFADLAHALVTNLWSKP